MTQRSFDWRKLNETPYADRSSVRLHLVGIGGAGLSAIARLLLQSGYCVSGSDVRASETTAELAELGATVFAGHRAEQATEPDPASGLRPSLVLVSSAVPVDNLEVLAAQAAGIPVVKRDQLLAPLLAGHLGICVAGTHGKTTTSALIATLLDAAGAEPSFIVGSEILDLGTSARAGRPGGPFILEADEYDRTFLGLTPDVAVITNVEWDHVDCYPNPQSFEDAFAAFAGLVPAGGVVIYCGDDPGARRLHRRAGGGQARWVSYGLEAGNHWRATGVEAGEHGTAFDLTCGGVALDRVSLSLPGDHNVRNALGALVACVEAGYGFTKAYKNLKILSKVRGTARRFDTKGESCGIIVLDDYAHHPTEVRATLSAARQRFPRRAIWVLFQPHTFSRTRALLHDFYNSFENADHVLITDIFAAREHDDMGVSATDLIAVLEGHPDARYVADLRSTADLLLAELEAGDVLLTLGAGDGYRVGEQVLAGLDSRKAWAVPDPGGAAALAAAIREELGLAVARDEPLANHTTMRVGGPAELFVSVGTVEQLVAVTGLARRFGVAFFVLGGGSNVLVADRGMRGLVIANRCRAVRRHEGNVVWAETGVLLAGLARQTLRWGLAGLEWGVSVPGTVGGAVVGNAGAFGGAVADNLLRVTLLLPDGSLAEWPAARLQLAYRSSVLKVGHRAGRPVPLVLSAAFRLEPAAVAELEERAASFLAHRRQTQPTDPSAGSIFQNPPGDYAGRILDSLGFKGNRRGGAAFSAVHANFIVNHGGATASDVVSLIDDARQAAWQALGVELTPEILFVGEWDRRPEQRTANGEP